MLEHKHAGLWIMVIGIFVMCFMDAFVKMLLESGVALVMILTVRSLIINAMILPTLAYNGKLHQLKTNRPVAQALRGLLGVVTVSSFFSSLTYLNLADATVIFFTGTLFIALASFFILKERMGPHRWFAVVVGYIGVAVAMQPSFSGEWQGYALALVGSIGYSWVFISGKQLSKTETNIALVFYFNLALGLVGLLFLPWFWHPVDAQTIVLLLMVAATALFGHLCITTAFSTTEASALAPFEYTALLWAIILDYVLWQAMPAASTLLGGAIIIASSWYFLHRENQALKRREAKPV